MGRTELRQSQPEIFNQSERVTGPNRKARETLVENKGLLQGDLMERMLLVEWGRDRMRTADRRAKWLRNRVCAQRHRTWSQAPSAPTTLEGLSFSKSLPLWLPGLVTNAVFPGRWPRLLRHCWLPGTPSVPALGGAPTHGECHGNK